MQGGRETGREGRREGEGEVEGEGEGEGEGDLSPGLIRTVAGLAAVSILGPLGRLSHPLSDSTPFSLDVREASNPLSRVADSTVRRARCRRGAAGAIPRHRLNQSRGRFQRRHLHLKAGPRVVMAHAAHTRVAAGRATCRTGRPWTLSRARGAPTHSRRHSMLMIRGCSLPPCTVRCGAMRLPVTGDAPPWMLRPMILPYPDLLLPRRRLLRRLPPRLSIMGISRGRMGGAKLSRSEILPLTRMMIRGVIGMVMVSPARCFTGPARPGWEMTSAPLLLRPPDGGVAIRREWLMAASTGRAPVPPVATVAGTRGGVTPRHPLQALRLVRCSGGMRRRRSVRLVRTSVRLTRGGRAAGRSGGGRRFPQTVHLCRGPRSVSPPCSTRSCPPPPRPRRPPTGLTWGRFPPGSLMRVPLGLLIPRCPTSACLPRRTSGGRGCRKAIRLTTTLLGGPSRRGGGLIWAGR